MEKRLFTFNKTRLKSVVKNLNKGKVLVIGDFAIDEMIYGKTQRISREAPVLILQHTHTNIILGAASNAAHNISTLNSGKVAAIGTYGDDYHGKIILEALQNGKIGTSYMVMDKSRPTTTKTRISGSSTQSVTQQIVRIDREENSPVNTKVENEIIDNINKLAPDFDAILLSDYGIGVMTPAIIEAAGNAARKNGIFLTVDTQADLTRFQKPTVITPNQPDTEKTLGYKISNPENLIKAGHELLEKTSSDMILITRGSEGMSLFEKNGNISDIPVFNKTEVFDVTGAGDTVIGSFTLALCAGATPAEASIIGNLAASIVVRHFGCATTTINELEDNLERLDFDNIRVNV